MFLYVHVMRVHARVCKLRMDIKFTMYNARKYVFDPNYPTMYIAALQFILNSVITTINLSNKRAIDIHSFIYDSKLKY